MYLLASLFKDSSELSSSFFIPQLFLSLPQRVALFCVVVYF